MEEEEDMLPTSPFWLRNHRPHRRHLRRSYSLILTSTSLIILLLVTALAFIFIVVPTLHSFTSNIFKPHSVKKSWDFLNLVLVLFAIVCGFLSKNNNTAETRTETRTETETQTPRSYYLDGRNSFSSNAPFNRLRSFNSYPDLRLESPWIAADERWRFHDDTHLFRYHRPRPEAEEEEELAVETVATVTSVEVATTPPKPSPSPPPPPSRKAVRRNARRTPIVKPENNDLSAENSQPQPATPPPPPPPPSPPAQLASRKAVRRNAKRPYQSETIEKPESNDLSAENLQLQPSASPPPPPPPPPPPERKLVHGKKKRGIATKEFLTSLRGKKKKQRQRSVENFDTILNSQPSPLASQPPPSAPPPPPPLPPPPSVFHNLFFSKKGKQHKKLLSNKIEHSYALLEDNVMITGNESPLIPIPPPPPPFKLPAWKFRVHGDFVRIDSIGSSSRSVSPDLDEVVESPISQQEEEEGSQCNNSPFAPLCPPSPDVDTKANTFIERFRAGLRMEKMNSIKKKHGIGRSTLGLSSPNTQANEETRPTS